jgi:hypothetical protein
MPEAALLFCPVVPFHELLSYPPRLTSKASPTERGLVHTISIRDEEYSVCQAKPERNSRRRGAISDSHRTRHFGSRGRRTRGRPCPWPPRARVAGGVSACAEIAPASIGKNIKRAEQSRHSKTSETLRGNTRVCDDNLTNALPTCLLRLLVATASEDATKTR